MGAAKASRLHWTIPPTFLIALGGGVLYVAGGRYLPNKQLLLQAEPKALFSTTSSVFADKDSKKTSLSDYLPGHGSRQDAHHDDAGSIWTNILGKFEGVKLSVGTPDWIELENLKNYIIPDWTRLLPASVQKLQRELSMAPGSLADEIWKEAHDPDINPEILRKARVRVGDTLCDEELVYRERRRKYAVTALASYLNINEEDIHPDDVPTIAMCGSGGGLRALVAGTGSYLAAQEAGLWDCVTYTAGVSGSCWLQTLYHSSITGRNFNKQVDHLKNRLGIHLAFPPAALKLLTTAPTNKYLLSGLVEKLKGDPGADFGLVDIYGMLLAARLLVPKGELGVCDRDLKLSNQRYNLTNGAHPLPIYTAVRHEIPTVEIKNEDGKQPKPEDVIKESKNEAWFQWFEFTPYEFFCEELGAGIPTWALGRHFYGGANVKREQISPIPELRVPGLMGIWGSAFCATLSHYYKEIRPVVRGITGFGGIDSLIQGKTKDLIRVHPIDPAAIPNYVLGMKDLLPASCPDSIFQSKHLRLMDAGMSNNLPIYPLLRPGRDVDVIIAFDASADIKRENWLSVVDGYARQRGIKGWPIGAGWPRESEEPKITEETLREPQNISEDEINKRMNAAKDKTSPPSSSSSSSEDPTATNPTPSQSTDLDYCNVWVGTKQEMVSDREPPPSKRLFQPRRHTSNDDNENDHSDSDFHLMRPDAGIAVVYFPLLPNPSAPNLPSSSALNPSRTPTRHSESTTSKKVSDPAKPLTPYPGSINPDVDDFLSTWNFVYTPEQIDSVVGLAKANFAQGEDQVKRVVRAVYERKKSDRLRREEQEHRQRLAGFVPI
ncbi:putative phospholipase A2 (PlaA) [Aspergillus brunneoviolaceus CBS 621.78]|uniref:FabD/lysophospholipase-like protein n=1 Tax=Aspergillus brunneoviolaceus CBS 621.78 TaxID=1450534 RepID=A0ACD1FY93_9EURO|nr:FabD/lysophospholipase-like protein [Aspergillus brunneoviolaceus CBS 621.78]RAH41932.1 FabD/lysophospholipase-like protein [Aspergillus brunneoviolaceus CBS 621.78]